MNYARLISVEYVVNNTIIDKNVDADLINKFIDLSQDLNIQTALGYNLYQTIMSMVVNNTLTDPVNINYYDLVTGWIQKCQALWVVYHILPYLNYHLTNKAISQKSSTNSQPSNLDELSFLRNDTKSMAEFYVARIREQIVNNTGLYPEYWATSGIDRIVPKSNNYFGGMYLPNRTKIPTGTTIDKGGDGCC